jgi:para-nitrobenzyl esterase
MADRVTDALLPLILAAQLAGEAADPAAAAERLVAGTRRILAGRGADASPAEVFYALQTELGLRWHSTLLAERHAAHQPRTFVYLFTWPSPLRGGALRACHALDLPFTFGTLDAPGMAALAGAGPGAERLSANVRAAWLAFARTGDPGHPGIGPWPPYDSRRRATMELGSRCGALDAPLEEERSLWAETLGA